VAAVRGVDTRGGRLDGVLSGGMVRGRPIFHLALPVNDLEASKRFYVGVLGARVGRETAEWLDVLVWGHQITLHHRPAETLPRERQGKRHFGVVLPWAEWQRLADRVRTDASCLRAPELFAAGTPDEHGKVHLEDPSHNVIEIKAYRDAGATLRLDE
jgi:extradiol dioxygenase family protein